MIPLPHLPRVALTAALAVSCAAPPLRDAGAAKEPAAGHVRTGAPPDGNPFLHAVGRDLVDGQGRKVLLRGICFGNDVWRNPAAPVTSHHGEAEYRMIRGLGMNAVRFYLNDGLFEDDRRPMVWKESGFEWLARNLAWARENGIYLVPNLHVPPGGFQSMAEGGRLWSDRRNQLRAIALWREIARRFRDEPALGGYDLLNEPVVTDDPAQWERLAREIADAIRAEDPYHAIFLERVNAVGRGAAADWSDDRRGDGEMNFFLLDDTNVVYEFHNYHPMEFTHQGAKWMPAYAALKATYPGPFRDKHGVERMADRRFVEEDLGRFIAFGRRHDVPLLLGEFGVIRDGFAEGRNGLGWVADMIDVTLGEHVSLTYHAFHEGSFGLYFSDGDRPPAPADLNRPLADLFAEKFRALP